MIDMKQKKKDMLVEFLKLGMDFDSACLAAEIDEDFKKELQYDDAFPHLANTAIAKKEVELLQKLEAIGEANAQRGESKQIERQLELLFEGHRWYDLVRNDRMEEVMAKATDKNGKPMIKDVSEFRRLMPIPQGQIDINERLEQNQGY